jgi:hypothetical protein
MSPIADASAESKLQTLKENVDPQQCLPDAQQTDGKNLMQNYEQLPRRRRVTAIVADYDNCFDFISPLRPNPNLKAWPLLAHWYPDPAEDKLGWTFDGLAELLENAIEAITHAREEVILFVGSARQSAHADCRNAKGASNGLCREAFEIMASQRGWKLDKALLDDYGTSLLEPAFDYDFTWFLERADKSGSRWSADPQQRDALPRKQEHLKKLIVTNAVAQLTRTNPFDEIDMYFFDDRRELLDAAKSVKTPENIRLHTVWFDHYGFYTGDVIDSVAEKHLLPRPQQVPLMAVGPDGSAEELLSGNDSAEENVKARMQELEDPFANIYDNWTRRTMSQQ